MRELLYGREKLSVIPIDHLNVLDGLFVPEREAMRAELLAARGESSALAAQIDMVRRDHPGLAWWMDDLLAGRSDIAWTRKFDER